ncbi:MAG TPA: hypothetical protein VFE98_03175 [Candidatus Bathyarchaeia archaeon]|nr:hypothetical protein [Candidatus Bathyarchaeia archaeon]
MKKEGFSAKPEAEASEALKPLTRPFVSELETPNEPVKDLNREDFSAKLEAILQVAVRLVEQERGLELQVSFPEFTLAIMLPIVIEIEPASVLKIEFFSVRPEPIVKEDVRDLRIIFFSTRFEARVRTPLKLLCNEVCCVRLEARVIEALRLAV